jgi:hypothetical protein
VVFSAFYFSKVFAYGLTFSILSTRKEAVQIYWQITRQETCKKPVPGGIALP